MSATRFSILLGDRCHAAAVTNDDLRRESADVAGASIEKQASTIVRLLTQLGYDSSPIVLGIASSQCLAARIDSSSRSQSKRPSHEAMAYQLENELPLSIEQAVVDFGPISDDAGSRLGVCVPIDEMKLLVNALVDSGVSVEVITPTVLLAAQAAAAKVAENGDRAWRIEHDGVIDYVRTCSGVPAAWSTHADEESFRRAAALDDLDVLLPESDTADAAARFAAQVLDESVKPWCDLRRDSLASDPGSRWARLRVPIRCAVAAAMILLATLSGIMLYRAAQYEEFAEEQRAAQLDVFAQTLPDRRATNEPLRHLRAEHRKLLGLIRAGDESGGDAAQLAQIITGSALSDLSRLLDALPSDRRYRVLEIQVEPDRVYIDGQARELADPDAIAQAIVRGGFEVNPPHAERLPDRGVSFVLTAVPSYSDRATMGDPASSKRSTTASAGGAR